VNGPIAKILKWLWQLPGLLAILLVRFYQLAISPMLGSNCRFTPTCSAYFIQSVQKYGFIRGTIRGLYRIARCNPWCDGGHDPP
jgi:putative membrane protein insertion efficiency factor